MVRISNMDWFFDIFKSEQQVLKELEYTFDINKAKDFLYTLCARRPEYCGSGQNALQKACEKNTSKKDCTTHVTTIMESFCAEEDNKNSEACTNQRSSGSDDGGVSPKAPAPKATDAPETTTASSSNMMLIGGAAAVVALILVGICIYFFCLKSSSPSTPPPNVTATTTTGQTTQSGKKSRKHKKKKKKKGNKKRETTGGGDTTTKKTKIPEDIV